MNVRTSWSLHNCQRIVKLLKYGKNNIPTFFRKLNFMTAFKFESVINKLNQIYFQFNKLYEKIN